MAWTIYSVGDGKFLEQILNGVAMIAGTGELSTLAGIGMLVGLIMLGLKSILNGGQGIQFQVFLVNYIIFMAMFGGKVTVVIDDVYNNKQHVVANVPQGVGIAGSIVSQIGLRSTELFEQGFSHVRMTDNGFASALKALSTLRQMTMTKAGIGTVNAMGSNGDLWRSWTNYIKDCTLVGVDLKQYTIDDIKKNKRFPNGSSMEQLRYDSNSYGTEIYLNAVPEVGGCAQMYGQLAARTPEVAQHNGILMDQLKGKLALDSAADASTQIDQALYAIGQSGVQTQQYMITTLLEPIFNWATIENEFSAQKAAAATMLHSSIQQRNAQWAAEQALFQTTVRPMMTFFEGLVYAITPIMAFLIGLGPMGFSLIGKYLMIMMWIQLWMPTLAIVNLYMNMSLSRSFNALTEGAAGVELASFYGMQAADQELQSWIATGGMLAAAVPGITLMLVYGSAVTATSLAGRMASGAADVDNMSPSALKNGPVHENSSQTNYNPTAGHQTTGAENIKKTLQMGSSHSSALSSMASDVSQQSNQLSHGLTQGFMSSKGSAVEKMDQVSTRLSEMGKNSSTYQTSLALGNQLVKGTALENSQNEQAIATLGAIASMGRGASLKGFFSANGQLTAEAKSLFGDTSNWSSKDSDQFSRNLQESEGRSSEFALAVAKDQASGTTDKFITQDMFSNSEQLSKQATDLHSSSQQYSAAATAQQTMGSNWMMNYTDVGGRLQTDPGMREDIQGFMSRWGAQGGLYSDANREAGVFARDRAINQQGLAGDMGSIYAIAGGNFLNNISDPELRAQAAVESQELMAKFSGTNLNIGDAQANAGIGRADASSARPAANLNGPGLTESGLDARGAATGNKYQGDPKSHYEAGQQGAADFYFDEKDKLISSNNRDINDNFPRNIDSINGRVNQFDTNSILGNMINGDKSTFEAFKGLLTGSNAMEGAVDQNGGIKGNAEDYMNLSKEEKAAEYANAQRVIAEQLRGDGMSASEAAYVAAEFAPAAVGYMYSGSLRTDENGDVYGNLTGRADFVERSVRKSDFHQDTKELYGGYVSENLGHLNGINEQSYKDTLLNIGGTMLLSGDGNDVTTKGAQGAYKQLHDITTSELGNNTIKR